MIRETTGDCFRTFYESPTPEQFRQLQQFVMSDDEYDPAALPLVQLGALFDDGRFDELASELDQLPQTWWLSPRFHFLAGIAAHELGDGSQSERRREAMQSCLKGLLTTGEGTHKQPFRVTYLTDEYDLMRVLGGDVRNQQVVGVGERNLDVITRHDGSEVWFDVTELLARMGQKKGLSVASHGQ